MTAIETANMAALPKDFAAIPRLALTFSTPLLIEPLDRLKSHLGQGGEPSARVFACREDMNSGLGGGGGNKLRKLEYVLADAVAQTPRPEYLVTEGGIQSNHVRQVAAAAAKLGFKSVLVINDLVPERSHASDPHLSRSYNEHGNVHLTELMSAAREEHPGVTAKELLDTKRGYWIPSGASTHPLGGLGYAKWAFDLVAREREMGLFFDSIVLSVMSGSTLGGMAAGFALVDELQKRAGGMPRQRRLIGVAAGPKPREDFIQLVSGIAETTGRRIGLEKHSLTGNAFEIDLRWHGDAYGRLDDTTRRYIKLAASTEGLVVDPVYSGKALTGACRMVEAGELRGNVLFVHTGGVLSLSAYPDMR
ncbi:D-cysteine desulfhydrase family protein [Metarhizium robertsii]|uniref:1-aminocyclopropane-1-carboxylate deaminase n=2 Tax=Metarhizium robertsii TaxID=568076 RepID=E9FAA2_METRA|nr:1-aminocyclopropane-1-carboxylate deaminase [Metarhizium robertsii ARSEF 23]EFY95387.1 1-aminocyclopropane-1-carboxylate deaminase [Metarhizium robertsii ARSEF 23]EXU97414.1 D-cysteine desulfhydrase family protein [Metarhizium robertsii]